MQAGMHTLLDDDILRLIVSQLPRWKVRALAQIPFFRTAALDELYRICNDDWPFLTNIFVDRSVATAQHQDCIGHPPADEAQFSALWRQTQFWTSRAIIIAWSDIYPHGCMHCVYSAAKALSERAPSPLYPKAVVVDCFITSALGLETFALWALFPRTLTKLDITVTLDGCHGRLAHVLRDLPALEHLHVNTERTTDTPLALDSYSGLSAMLRVLEIEDTRALTFDDAMLRELIGGYPRLTALSLNPWPKHVGDRDALPSLRCLEVLSAQPSPASYAPALERFAALLRFEPVNWDLPPPRPNRLRELNFGASRSCDGMDDVKAYVRRLFPGAKVRAKSTGVAEMDKDEM
ncbi:hypothetical protein PsYK624_003620 [Phanerochaete sordida]|uniref:F-box domain-containing protein n=1 Tax=Phanerochaete sordida TaxID=48140 RepID=A0A9P3FXB0_9APHY|nr:hypothetical protein PsYK624_003620 [Phanerochaete sordida]